MSAADDEIDPLVQTLGLAPHPEGGWYRELHRARGRVRPEDGRPPRDALTSILFLLARGGHSAWHRVASDEAWHAGGGGPVELLVSTDAFESVERTVIGPPEALGGPPDATPLAVVPAHAWQAARALAGPALVGCSVGPGFDFEDFTLLRDDPEARDRLVRLQPALARFA